MGTMKNTLVHMANGLHRLEQLLQRMINKQEQKQMKKIGIIGAMELEVETLKSKMNVVKTTKKANMEFYC